MAQPTNDSFSWAVPERFVVRIGTASTITGTGTGGMLQQIKSIKGETTGDKPVRSVRRLGASPTQAFALASYQSTCTIVPLASLTEADYMTATGDASPAEMNSDLAVNIQAQLYSDAGALKVTRHLIDAYMTKDSWGVDADNDNAENGFDFVSANKWIVTTYS